MKKIVKISLFSLVVGYSISVLANGQETALSTLTNAKVQESKDPRQFDPKILKKIIKAHYPLMKKVNGDVKAFNSLSDKVEKDLVITFDPKTKVITLFADIPKSVAYSKNDEECHLIKQELWHEMQRIQTGTQSPAKFYEDTKHRMANFENAHCSYRWIHPISKAEPKAVLHCALEDQYGKFTHYMNKAHKKSLE